MKIKSRILAVSNRKSKNSAWKKVTLKRTNLSQKIEMPSSNNGLKNRDKFKQKRLRKKF